VPPAHLEDFLRRAPSSRTGADPSPDDVQALHHKQARGDTRQPPWEHSLSKPIPPPLLSIRTALIFLLGVLCGTAVAALTALTQRNLTEAALAGLTATGSAIVFFHKAIDPDTPRR